MTIFYLRYGNNRSGLGVSFAYGLATHGVALAYFLCYMTVFNIQASFKPFWLCLKYVCNSTVHLDTTWCNPENSFFNETSSIFFGTPSFSHYLSPSAFT